MSHAQITSLAASVGLAAPVFHPSHASLEFRGEFQAEVVAMLLKQLETAVNYYQYKRIDLHIHSPGGEVGAMRCLLRGVWEAQQRGVEFRTVTSQLCASAAAWLLASGTWGQRCVGVDATLVFHNVRAVTHPGRALTANDAHELARKLDSADQMSAGIVSRMIAQAGGEDAFARVLAWRLQHAVDRWEDSRTLMKLQMAGLIADKVPPHLLNLLDAIQKADDPSAVVALHAEALGFVCREDMPMDVRISWALGLIDEVEAVLVPHGLPTDSRQEYLKVVQRAGHWSGAALPDADGQGRAVLERCQ